MKRNRKTELKFEVVDAGEMPEENVEAIAKILFEWWKRDYEEQMSEPIPVGRAGTGSQA